MLPLTELHAQDIRGLSPAPAWTLLIDETGDRFDAGAQALDESDRRLGRWVALLAPDQNPGLSPLPPGWHAVDKGLAEIDRVVQAVLDSRAGVLGLTVQQLPVSTGERWAAGVLTLIDWVLRLLPLPDSGPTKLKVCIENRFEFIAGMEWPALRMDAMRRLALAFPERARRLVLEDIRLIGKAGSPLNGYVDALAFTWGSPAASSRERLRASGLLGTCFLEGDVEQVLKAWEWLERGITIHAADWARLLAEPDARVTGGLTATILERLGEAARHDTRLWLAYLEECRHHLDSKAVNLRRLGAQIDWLERYRPEMDTMPPRLRLLWLTSRLAHANHLGAVEQGWMAELVKLADRLMDEDAPLVAWANLHLAVHATNRFDFDLASRSLARWCDIPPAAPGLRYWGQIASSLGQHAAFSGQPEPAREHFQRALAAFARLSEPAAQAREASQTANYLAIVEMDHGDPDTARAAVERVIGPLHEAIRRLANTVKDEYKYQHHLLLRWLVFRGDPMERAEYLEHCPHCQTGAGHPWPLIQLYRGMLLHDTDPAAARELAEDAWRLANAPGQGPTVRLIGACCRVIAAAWGLTWTEAEAEAELTKLAGELPMAAPRFAALRAWRGAPAAEPRALLAAVLPFNFH